MKIGDKFVGDGANGTDLLTHVITYIHRESLGWFFLTACREGEGVLLLTSSRVKRVSRNFVVNCLGCIAEMS